MAGQKGFWDVEERLAELSAEGDSLEKLSATVDFEVFRPILLRALRQADEPGDRQGQCEEIDGALPCRARLR